MTHIHLVRQGLKGGWNGRLSGLFAEVANYRGLPQHVRGIGIAPTNGNGIKL